MRSKYDPTTRTFVNVEGKGPAPFLSATVHDSKPGPTRADILNKIGAPANATDDEALAILDAKIAARKPAPQPQESAEDALYDLAFGNPTASTDDPLSAQETALYEAVFGVDHV